MKKIFTLLTALLCTVAQVSWAECYVLEEASEEIAIGAYSNSSGMSYSLNGYGDLISVNLRKAKDATQSVEIYGYTANGSEKHLKSVGVSDLSTSHTLFEIGIDTSIVSIKIKAGGTLNKYFKDLKVRRATFANQPASPHIDFGKAKVKSADATISTTMSWCNVNQFSYTIDGDKDQFSVSIENNASTCAQGTATVTVTYAHNVVGEHNATLTLSNGTFTHTITLSGATEKKDQQLEWANDYNGDQITLPVGKEVSDAATATSGNAVTYTSSDENVVAIINGGAGFKAVGAGTAEITATQAGDDTEWNAVSATKTVVVTEKKIQSILWTDNLSRLKVGDADVPLTAVVRVLTITDGEETYEENSIRTALLQYSSADESIVKVNHLTKTLSIVGEGTTTVTASVAGDLWYEAASVTMPVKVRAASALCDAYVLDDAAERTLNTIDEETYTINGPASQLVFTANRTKLAGFSGGNLKVDIYYDGGWHNIFNESVPLSDYQTYGPYAIPRNTTQVKFYTETGATGYKHVKDVAVTMAHYLETTTPSVTVDKSIIGDAIACTATIQYSNLPDEVPVTNSSDHIVLADESLGNVCGKFGEKTIRFTAYPTAVGEIHDTLVISEPLTGLGLRIPVLVKTQRNTQTITWDNAPDSILTTDEVTLTASAQTAITYSSSDKTVAYVGAENQLVVVKAGEVTITATAAQDEKYEEATLSKTITIALATPTIIAAPTLTVESVGYGEALTNDLLTGGEASVEGVFTWNIAADTVYLPGTHEVPVLFTPENTDWYATAETTVSVLVTKKTQTITWNFTTTIISVGDTLILDATATSGYAVTYDLDPTDIATLDGNKLTAIAAGTLTITANQDGVDEEGNQNYYAATPISFTITIASASTGNGLVITEVRAQKVVHNGEVVIIRGEEVYNMRGQRVE